MRPRSLRARITAVAVVGVCVAMVAVGLLLVRYVRISLEHEMDARLLADTDQVVSLLPSLASIDIETGSVLTDPAGRSIQTVGPDGALLGGELFASDRDRIALLAAPFPWETGELPRTLTSDVDGIGEMRVRVTAIESPRPPEVRYLVVGRPLSSIDRSAATVTRALLIGMPLIIAMFGWLIWMMVGRVLRPVERLRRDVSDISARDLSRRVDAREAGDEIDRLAGTMNEMLSRLEAAAERERQLVADASHELRSPLAAVRALVETRGQVSGDAADEHDAHAIAAVARLQALIDELLDVWRYDALPGRDGDETSAASARLQGKQRLVDLDDIVLEQANRLRHTTTLTIDTSRVSGGQVLGSQDALRRMIENLSSNASRHASTVIQFVVEQTDDAVLLEVVDDGIGIAAEDRERVFERFTRLAEARERDTGGTGLGLAIAKGVVLGHRGTIEVAETESGVGAAFRVRFPVPD